MKTLTLCESVFRAQSQPFNSKPSNSRSSSPLLRLLRKESKHSSRNWRFCLSRYSRLLSQYVKKDKELLGCSGKSVSASMHAIVSVHDDNDKETSKSISIDHDCSHLDRLPGEISTMDEPSTFGNQDAVPVSEAYHEVLKLGLLFGLFTFQGPQQAMASSDFASGILSMPFIGDLGDISTGFASAFLLIFFSELGDKTFFIANFDGTAALPALNLQRVKSSLPSPVIGALLAARNSGFVVFIGTFGALAAMTIVSVILGRTFHYVDEILPFRFAGTDLPIDDIAAVCLLVYFGVSTLLEASSSDGLKAAEEQKEAELAVSNFSGNGAGILSAANTVISTFALVFVAEWGDKSFFSTIALAAASSPLGVVGGALAGHAVATLLAVVGGSLLGTFFSEKVIAYVGGVLFLVFAVVTLIEIFN